MTGMPKKRKNGGKLKISREELRKLYLTDGLTAKQIAEKCGVSHGTVAERIIKLGLSRRRRTIPMNPDLKKIMPALGPVKEPETFVEEVIEHIDSHFMFGGYFESFEEGAREVIEILSGFIIRPSSKKGQSILQEFVKHCLEEYYGDFYRWSECRKCSKEFKPKYTLAYVNEIISATDCCPECKRKLSRKEKE